MMLFFILSYPFLIVHGSLVDERLLNGRNRTVRKNYYELPQFRRSLRRAEALILKASALCLKRVSYGMYLEYEHANCQVKENLFNFY